jgi:hypothetical protein
MVLKIRVLVVMMVGFERVVIYFYVGFPSGYSFNLHEVLAEFYVYKNADFFSPPSFLSFPHPSPPWCELPVVLQLLPSQYELLMMDECRALVGL